MTFVIALVLLALLYWFWRSGGFGRLADAIDPPDGVSRARLLLPMKFIDAARRVFKPGGAPKATNGAFRGHDGTGYRYWSDGSIRRRQRKPTKEEKKANRRARSRSGL